MVFTLAIWIAFCARKKVTKKEFGCMKRASMPRPLEKPLTNTRRFPNFQRDLSAYSINAVCASKCPADLKCVSNFVGLLSFRLDLLVFFRWFWALFHILGKNWIQRASSLMIRLVEQHSCIINRTIRCTWFSRWRMKLAAPFEQNQFK